MTYALWDFQNDCYMHTGYGAATKNQLKEELLEYISVDFDTHDPVELQDWKTICHLPVEEIAAMWDMDIQSGDFIRNTLEA